MTRLGLSLWFALLVFIGFAQPHPQLAAGPMTAYSEMTEVAVWVQTRREADVQIAYRPVGTVRTVNGVTRAHTGSTPVVRTRAEHDYCATLVISDLPFGQRFEYELLINGQRVQRDYPLRFQTQPHWLWDMNPRVPPTFAVAFGSCAYFNDPYFDRPGAGYGGDYQIFESIRQENPDLMLWLGDNFYLRETDWNSVSGLRYRFRQDRSVPELQPLLGSVHHYATWDDHDYGPNDSDTSYRLKHVVLDLHRRYWPGVQYGLADHPGVFQRFEWADAEFFMLDNRYHRTPNRMQPGPDKMMLGRKQLDWLKQSLRSSLATFKIIANGGQMLNSHRFEEWSDFADERKEFLDFLMTEKIEGVVFLSGDRHAGELLKLERANAYSLFELTSSPLTSGLASSGDPDPIGVPNTKVLARNFGMLRFQGGTQDRQLTLALHDSNGKTLVTHTLKASDLRFPRWPSTLNLCRTLAASPLWLAAGTNLSPIRFYGERSTP